MATPFHIREYVRKAIQAERARVCAALRRAAESVDGPARAALIEAAREVEG